MTQALDYELAFWGDCSRTFREEQKQLVYAQRMGLLARWDGAHPPYFDMEGRSVVDIGGGPVSLLLKCENLAWGTVVDPAPYPEWVLARYQAAGIGYRKEEAEDLAALNANEAWIYNVLQHVRDPKLVIERALATARIVRIFEWIEIDPYPGHPHRLDREQLDEWLGAPGFVATLDESGAHGTAYYGVFNSRVAAHLGTKQ